MKLPTLITTTVALTLLSLPLLGQLEPASEPSSIGPLGGSAISIVVDPQDPDVSLVVSYLDGVSRSTDGAATYSPYGTGLSSAVREIVQDPTDDQGLYAVDGNRVFKSADFGATWSPLSLVSAEPLKGMAVPGSGNGVLAFDSFNIYHSPDGGANWSVAAAVVPFSGDVFDSIAYSADGSVAYVGTFDGVGSSSDGGASFTLVSGAFTEWVQAVTVSPTDADTIIVGTPFAGLHRSTDGGANFTPITDPLTAGNAEFFLWEPGGALWYATLSTLVHSPDGGTTWFDATTGWPLNTPIPSTLAVDSNGVRYLGCEGGGLHDQSGGGLYRMPAGALSAWTHIGFLNALINETAIAGPGGLRVIGIGSGVYAGAQGATVTPTVWTADIGTDTRAIAIDPDDSTRWVTGGVGAFFDNAQIVVLTGNGTNFVKTYEAFGPGVVQDIAFNPSDPDHMVAGIFPANFGNEAIIFSSNRGNSWIDVAGTVGWATRAVAYDPHTSGRVLQLSDNNQWAESNNSGQTWSALQPPWPGSGPAVLLTFDPYEPGVIYRGDTGNGLWRSDDDGANWTSLGVSLQEHSEVELHPEIPGMLWVSNAAGQVLVSTDRGDNFQLALDVPLDANGANMSIDTADGSLLVGTTAASTWELENASAVVRLGEGTAGSGGIVPRFYPQGLPQVGNAGFAIAGDGLLGGALYYLAYSGFQTSANVYGGTFHVGTPLALISLFAGGPAGVPGAGSFVINASIPNDPLLVGLTAYAQYVVIDSGAPHISGKALSDGLAIRLH